MFKSEYNVIKKSGLFDEDYYHRMYEDVKGTNLEAIKHYIELGWKEGKNPSDKFDTKYYLDTYKDVRDANVNPLLHYIKHG